MVTFSKQQFSAHSVSIWTALTKENSSLYIAVWGIAVQMTLYVWRPVELVTVIALYIKWSSCLKDYIWPVVNVKKGKIIFRKTILPREYYFKLDRCVLNNLQRYFRIRLKVLNQYILYSSCFSHPDCGSTTVKTYAIKWALLEEKIVVHSRME